MRGSLRADGAVTTGPPCAHARASRTALVAACAIGVTSIAACGAQNDVAAVHGDGGSTGNAATTTNASTTASAGGAPTYFVSVLQWAGGGCLPVALPQDQDGQVPCDIFYVLAGGDSCGAHPGLSPAAPEVVASLRRYESWIVSQAVCVQSQLPSSAWVNGSCATSSQPGWCYVTGAAAGGCPQDLALSPSGAPPAGASTLLACGPTAGATAATASAASVGTACTPAPELDASFAGFDRHEVVLDDGNAACSSAVCLVNHFQGRTTCPYGQDASGDPPPGAGACTVPGTGAPVRPNAWLGGDAGAVSQMVPPQCGDRRASDAVYCSCRCANAEGKTDDGAAYCACPSGYGCTQLVALIEPGDPLAGAYCIKDGTAFDASSACSRPCDAATMSCP
ncbi:MAG TPA: hypothetical protein VE987_07960 [Polyangiaceae bacterium]|nr:hypothetical protein [Polyangiaceae bacterium]